ncbi:unnamed protein product [Euphydryas editha]|uniref:Uncharacterized protein n=1 Tax=Euphydryas editha TaxID=104508 RepID=A0AAU9V5W4_EUPED|nr:unnamed protein product [Euphydryas editha]
MWYWRKIGISWTAYCTNVSILQELEIQTRLSTICLRRVLEYIGYIARNDDDNLEKLRVTGNVDGKRLRSRSLTPWTDQICTTLDRNEWRRVIHKKLLLQGGSHDPQH